MRRPPPRLAWNLWVLVLLLLTSWVILEYIDSRATVVVIVSAAAGFLAWATIGAVVASRQPQSPLGWLLLAGGLFGSGQRYGGDDRVVRGPLRVPLSRTGGVGASRQQFCAATGLVGPAVPPLSQWAPRLAALASGDVAGPGEQLETRVLGRGAFRDPRVSEWGFDRLRGCGFLASVRWPC